MSPFPPIIRAWYHVVYNPTFQQFTDYVDVVHNGYLYTAFVGHAPAIPNEDAVALLSSLDSLCIEP